MSQAGVPDLSYTPGDLTEPQYRLPSHQLLLDQKHSDPADSLPFSRLTLDNRDTQPIKYREPLGSAAGRQFPALAEAQNRYTDHLERSSVVSFDPGKDLISLPTVKFEKYDSGNSDPDLIRKMPLHSITEKPNERCPSPVVPAYANFELAKRMHQDNLDHQPLPDCVADLAFRRAQISGGHAGLSLEIDPIATGVGVKTHNAGPTHCTKMKVFRPKTGGGIVPKAIGGGDPFRGVGSAPAKKMGPMDLAICWDFKPANPADEPRLARHIDGSNDSAGPAVFTCVKTPREDQGAMDLGRSAGVFTSTLGEADFFDKDILRKRTDFGGARLDREDPCACDYSPPARQRARSVSRDSSASHCRRPGGLGSGAGGAAGGGVSFGNLTELPGRGMPDRLAKQYQSSPLLGDKAYQALREKYLGPESGQECGPMDCRNSGGPPCKRDTLLRRPARRLCHKVAPAPSRCCPGPTFPGHGHGHGHGHCLTSKAAFRAGVPKHNASGDFVGVDGDCGGGGIGPRVLVVPRPRQPYSKKNYDIDTLVPPFRSQAGGAGQGGYPEHWRLASVYQHAYKPLDQRRRPLLQTVYK